MRSLPHRNAERTASMGRAAYRRIARASRSAHPAGVRGVGMLTSQHWSWTPTATRRGACGSRQFDCQKPWPR